MSSTEPKNIIIGLDGVPYGLVEQYCDRGITPNLNQIINNGTFRKMKSTLPAISSVSWSSIITGDNPGQHGVFGFTDLIPNTYTISYPNFKSLQSRPFWHQDTSGRHVILNVPFTYPAKPLNGKLVSGFVAPELEKAVYPDDLLPDLREIDYRVDVDSRKGHQSKELLLDKLFEVLETRERALDLLWEENWDVFTYVITSTDRLMHFSGIAFKMRVAPIGTDLKNFSAR